MRTNRRTYRQTDRKKIIVVFRSFANAPKSYALNVQFDELPIDLSKSALCTCERCAQVRSPTINHIHIKSGSLRVYKSPNPHLSQVKYVLLSTSESYNSSKDFPPTHITSIGVIPHCRSQNKHLSVDNYCH